MPSIIEQIQRDAIDDSVRVSSLLRRVKLAAAKLDLPDVEAWVEHELEGYRDGDVPEYRTVHGSPGFHNPYHGWQTIRGDVESFSTRSVTESLASIEDLLAATATGRQLEIKLPYEIGELIDKLNNTSGGDYRLQVGRNQLVAIVDHVRSAILDWAIRLEKAGISGTGSEFSFDSAEKTRAQALGATINIGSIGSFAGNLGSGNTAGAITVSDIRGDEVAEFVRQVRNYGQELVKAAGFDGADLERRLAAIEKSIAMNDNSKLRGLLIDFRNALSGATGNLIASGVISQLNMLLGTGVPPL